MLLKECDNLGCRKIAVKRIQCGQMTEIIEVEHDLNVCAYCADKVESEYREENPHGFVRELEL